MVWRRVTPAPSRRPPICNAPFASLHLDPRGNVRACCQNTWQLLGNVTERGLRDIWTGPEATELRARLADHDLGLGCELCAVEVELGAPESAFLHVFDDLPPTDPTLQWPRQLELALSIACNLQCVMCNGDLSSSIRIHREHRPALAPVYGDAFFADLDPFLPHLERITFLGGEPFLGPETLRVMDRLIELELRPTCHINTNGTQWNDRVRRIFQRLPLHVAVSVDGWTKATIEAIRVGVDHATLLQTIDAMREECRRHGSSFSLTFCLMPQNAEELPEVLAWGDALDCDVFVNTVTNPPRYSLHHAGSTEIAGLLAAAEARDPWCQRRLGRNLAAWTRALDHIRAIADQRSSAGDPGVDTAAWARAQVASWSDRGEVVTMEVDESLVITRIEPDPGDAFGVDVTAAVGASSIAFMEAVGAGFGRLVSTSLEMAPGGVELRSFRYDGPTATHEVRAAMAKRTGGETWFVGHRLAGRHTTPVKLRARLGSAGLIRTPPS